MNRTVFLSFLLVLSLIQGVCAAVNEKAASVNLFVNPGNPRASDENDGTTPATAVRTVSKALQLAGPFIVRQNKGVRIMVGPGIYRESVTLNWMSNAKAPLIIQGPSSGLAIFRGSAPMTKWVKGADGRWEHEWNYKWDWTRNKWRDGFKEWFDSYEKNADPALKERFGEHIFDFRRELLFINGNPLRQVYKESELEVGTYFVNETDSKLVLLAPPSFDPRKVLIEASHLPEERETDSTRGLLSSWMRSHIVLRNLTFEHCNLTTKSAVSFLGCSDILIENCTFQLNNGVGLSIEHWNSLSKNITVRNCRFLANGLSGFTGTFAESDISNIQVHRNGWRAAQTGFTGWANQGAKFAKLRKVSFDTIACSENYGTGFWLDTDCADVVIRRLFSVDNARVGIYIEKNQGPIRLQDSLATNNGAGGLRTDGTSMLLMSGNYFVNNGVENPEWVCSSRNDEHMTFDTKQVINLEPKNYRFEKNHFVNTIQENPRLLVDTGKGPREKVYVPDSHNGFLQTRTSANNIYFHASSERVFRNADGEAVSLDVWLKAGGRDQGSKWDGRAAKAAVKLVEQVEQRMRPAPTTPKPPVPHTPREK